MLPTGALHLVPLAVGLEAELEQPVRLAFFVRYQPYHLLAKTRRDDVAVDIAVESVFIVIAGGYAVEQFVILSVIHILYVDAAFRICYYVI